MLETPNKAHLFIITVKNTQMHGVLWTATLEGKCNLSADSGLSSNFETEFLVKKMRTETSGGVSKSSPNQSYKFIHDLKHLRYNDNILTSSGTQ